MSARRAMPRMAAGAVALVFAPTLHLAAEMHPAPPPNVLAFDRFVSISGPVCEYQPARDCVDLAWDFADYNGDDILSVDELWLVRDMLENWAAWRQADLTAQEQNGIAFGLWLVDGIGLERLQSAYDADRDGGLTRDELLADLELDERTLSAVLLDPDAVDRAAVARRFGTLFPFLEEALP